MSKLIWSPSTQKPEKNYSYTDNNWKDKLTLYNGTNITYDAMGNPLSYRDGMAFMWKNGRQLDTITKSNNTFEFKYNSNGMCTQKDDDNYTTNYYYDSNNNLVRLNIGGTTLFFYYDSDGNVTSFSNNDTMYYYVKNLQGDMVKIIDKVETQR